MADLKPLLDKVPRSHAAVLALGIALGAGGITTLGALTLPTYDAHALMIRKQWPKDGGTEVTFTAQAWGTRALLDGGRKSVGNGEPCELNSEKDKACEAQLLESAAACIKEEK